MSSFAVKLLYPDSQVPTKAHADDSGWDVYAHTFSEVWSGSPAEYCVVPDASGLIPGFTGVDGVLTLNPGERVVVGCGFAGYAPGRPVLDGVPYRIGFTMVPRSGNRRKRGIEVHLGTVDYPYRGEFCAILTNLGGSAVTLSRGDRVAQVVPVLVPMLELVVADTLDATDRGDSGFGDSGIR